MRIGSSRLLDNAFSLNKVFELLSQSWIVVTEQDLHLAVVLSFHHGNEVFKRSADRTSRQCKAPSVSREGVYELQQVVRTIEASLMVSEVEMYLRERRISTLLRHPANDLRSFGLPACITMHGIWSSFGARDLHPLSCCFEVVNGIRRCMS